MQRTNIFKAIVMSAVLAMGISTAAMANVDVNKIYKLANEGTASPEETFTFTVTPKSCTNPEATVPQLTGVSAEGTVTIAYDRGEATVEGAEQKVKLTFPTEGARVGEYVYEIREVAGNTPGVTYSDTVITATVTVVNVENSSDVEVGSVKYNVVGGKLGDGEGFENLYEAAQSLQISKTVTGNLGDKSKYFDVSVTLNGADGLTFDVTTANDANPKSITTGTPTTFKLKHGENISIANIPYGVTYTVKEADYTAADKGGYEAAKYTVNGNNQGTTSVSGEAVDAATETVVITNTKGTSIDTGVIVENLPYIILIAVVLVAVVVLFFRKRANADLD